MGRQAFIYVWRSFSFPNIDAGVMFKKKCGQDHSFICREANAVEVFSATSNKESNPVSRKTPHT
jgi:hypothetical protein